MNHSPKKTTLAGRRAWKGFRKTAYSLAYAKVSQLPITTELGEQTTVGKVFESLRGAESLEIESPIVTLIVKTSAGEIHYKGSDFNLDVLYVLLKLRKDPGPLSAAFFFYASHTSRGQPLRTYNFFVVSSNAIVEESLGFRHHPESGFEPSVFLLHSDDELWREAWVRSWYYRFYTETETGQLMASRPGWRELYYFGRIRWVHAVFFVVFLIVWVLSVSFLFRHLPR
jgi:hypothetical protein